MGNGKFDFAAYDSDNGNSAFGRGRAMDLKPVLPQSTRELIGIDLTHRIDMSEIGSAVGGGGGGAQGAKPGGGSSFAPYTAGPANGAAGYNIVIEFKGTSWTQAHYDIFVESANRYVQLILGDIPNVTVTGTKGGPKVVDDILITAELGNIDGSGGVLGQAGPTAVRTQGSLPATAIMKFDIVDVNELGLAVFTDVVLHEMAHSLGFGSIWSRLGLVSSGLFTGDLATQEYHDMGGTLSGVPVEQDGGSGTAGSHWDEETFANELMTGFIDEGTNYFTAMSAGSFGDLGYVITANYEAWADPGYIFPG